MLSVGFRSIGLQIPFSGGYAKNPYLETAIAKAQRRRDVPDEYLTYLAPFGGEYITLTRDYIWQIEL